MITMGPGCRKYSSVDYSDSNFSQGGSSLPQNGSNSIEMELGPNNSFLGQNRSCTINCEMGFHGGESTFFPDDNQQYSQQRPSNSGIDEFELIQGINFNQQIKQLNHLHYTQQNQLAKNIDEDPFIPNPTNTISGECSFSPLTCNSASYNQSSYVEGSTGSNSIDLAYKEVITPQSFSDMTSLALSQPESGDIQSAHPSPLFGKAQFKPPPDTTRLASIGTTNNFYFGPGSYESNVILPQFQGHRRTPSEYSDVSTNSAQYSPNIGQLNIFEQKNSPMQNAQDSSLYQDVLRIGNFSLSEPQTQHVSSQTSPSCSPVVSPHNDLQGINVQNTLICGAKEEFPNSHQIYPQESFPSFKREMGSAKQMIPPEINVEFAPATRPSFFEPSGPVQFDQDALVPIDKGRRRAFTDTTTSTNSNFITRPRNSSCVSPQITPEFDSHSVDHNQSLSPYQGARINNPYRIRRQSTPSPPNPDYILGLVDPEYQATTSESGKLKRAQKHPATFQCSLCPKRFTRAYNLRSHLRTHTDERPFICTVCNKAFARQHDRKRHEGLHSGEKKFICKGELTQGGQWGCGRRFARADALGRHFRSEAGRVCINPLLDEESREMQRLWKEQLNQNVQQAQPPISQDPNGLSCNFILPAALIEQYPVLATLSYSGKPKSDVGIEDDPGGRSSFDASGSEYYEEAEEIKYV
ncbi:C2H2 finger domain transcription factor crzA [Golovinomyces cichoracearum]|uniref:C2H2 finger domain transcription factor crzA n=1 Tax=Golovinomyces cichoracearum TaxID=62708 RepID=A0A420IVI3_9PEZI|nr:C2H2 finger domain transcription factor crzA [Golovinomyces cichoracearum]